jgi:hypothetical protein
MRDPLLLFLLLRILLLLLRSVVDVPLRLNGGSVGV